MTGIPEEPFEFSYTERLEDVLKQYEKALDFFCQFLDAKIFDSVAENQGLLEIKADVQKLLDRIVQKITKLYETLVERAEKGCGPCLTKCQMEFSKQQ